MYNLVSFAGIFILMAFAWLLSADRSVVNWRVVIWGLALQMLFAIFIFTRQPNPGVKSPLPSLTSFLLKTITISDI